MLIHFVMTSMISIYIQVRSNSENSFYRTHQLQNMLTYHQQYTLCCFYSTWVTSTLQKLAKITPHDNL